MFPVCLCVFSIRNLTTNFSLVKDPKTWRRINFSSLSSLIVHGCGSLKQLVPSGICGSLMQLERLEISDCPMIEEFIAINEQEEFT